MNGRIKNFYLKTIPLEKRYSFFKTLYYFSNLGISFLCLYLLHLRWINSLKKFGYFDNILNIFLFFFLNLDQLIPEYHYPLIAFSIFIIGFILWANPFKAIFEYYSPEGKHLIAGIKDIYKNLKSKDKPFPAFFSGKPFCFTQNLHSLWILTSGSGKSASLVGTHLMSSILCKRSQVIIDFKGDLLKDTAESVMHLGSKIICFNPYSTNSAGFNLFNPINFSESGIDATFQMIFTGLFPESESQGNSKYFTDRARNICRFMTLAYFYFKDGVINMEDFTQLMLGQKGDEIFLFIVENNIEFDAEIYDEDTNTVSATSYFLSLYAGFINKETIKGNLSTIATESKKSGQTWSSVYSTINNKINQFTSPNLLKNFSGDDFTFEHLRKTPTTLYLVVRQDMLEQSLEVLELFLTLMINNFTGAKKEDDKDSLRTIEFFLDEFSQFKRGSYIISQTAFTRSFKVLFHFYIQNLPGFLANYKTEQFNNIASSCEFVGFGDINDSQTAEFFSKYLGKNFATKDGEKGKQIEISTEEITQNEARDQIGAYRVLVFVKGLRKIVYLDIKLFQDVFKKELEGLNNTESIRITADENSEYHFKGQNSEKFNGLLKEKDKLFPSFLSELTHLDLTEKYQSSSKLEVNTKQSTTTTTIIMLEQKYIDIALSIYEQSSPEESPEEGKRIIEKEIMVQELLKNKNHFKNYFLIENPPEEFDKTISRIFYGKPNQTIEPISFLSNLSPENFNKVIRIFCSINPSFPSFSKKKLD